VTTVPINILATNTPTVIDDRLNEAQRQAVLTPITTGLQVIAGAGTGKTHLMAHRFVHLVRELSAQGVSDPQDRILAVTFTVKAAEEMQHRIQTLLAAEGLAPLSPQAWVTHFHGFANRLVRQYAADFRLTPELTIMGGLDKRLFVDALMQGIVNGAYSDIATILSHYGLAHDIPHHILSLAWLQQLPLTNKAAFIAQLPPLLDKIKSTGLSPSGFYQTAQHQTKAFSNHLRCFPLTDFGHQPFDSNYDYGLAIQQFVKPFSDAQWQLFDADSDGDEKTWRSQLEWLADFKVAGERLFPWYDLRKKQFLSGTADFGFLDDIDALEHMLIQLMAAVYAVYQHTLQQHNACDFDDLINHAVTLLHAKPDIRTQYQSFFKAIIVDEFQDSNASQLQLIRLLTDTSAGCNLTVVGDLKQSIYGFRHAQPENMARVFDGIPSVNTVTLHTNYRSAASILSVANRMAVRIVGDDTQQLVPCASETLSNASSDALATTEPDVVHWVMGSLLPEEKQPIDVIQQQEVDTIAAKIQALVADGHYQPRDMAVLVKDHRKADWVSRGLRDKHIASVKEKYPAFLQEPIILDALALLMLMDNPQDELPWVRLLQKKLNHRQLRLLSDYRYHHKQSLFQTLLQLADSTVLPELHVTLRTALVSLVTAVEAIQAEKHWLDPVAAFLKLVRQVGLIDATTDEIDKVEQRVLLNTFKKLLYQLVKKQEVPDLTALMVTLKQLQENPNLLELPFADEAFAENAVRILTIYAAKGLEFPVVFVAACDSRWDRVQSSTLTFEPHSHFQASKTQHPQSETLVQTGDTASNSPNGFGLFLSKHSHCQDFQRGQSTLKQLIYKYTWQKPRALAEARRLFYVAVTRARTQLYVTTCQQSPQWLRDSLPMGQSPN